MISRYFNFNFYGGREGVIELCRMLVEYRYIRRVGVVTVEMKTGIKGEKADSNSILFLFSECGKQILQQNLVL